MDQKKRIVILGGGYGGVEAARKLYRKFGKDRNVELTFIDKNPYHTLMTELHEVAGARVEEDSVQIPFRKIFGGKRINFVIDRIQRIDFEKQVLRSDLDEYEYDYLVLGTGGEPECYGIPGVEENSLTLWSLEDALAIREHVQEVFRQASREPDAERRRKLLTLVVAGAGFTGIELVGEFLEWKKQLCLEHGVSESEVRIIVVEAMSKILPNFPEHLSAKAERYLRSKGAEFMLNSPIVEAGPDFVKIKDGTVLEMDTMVWTCGIQGAEFAANLALTKGKCTNRKCRFATTQGTCGLKDCQFAKDQEWIEGKRGRLLTNDYMQSADYPNVYLVGDIVWYQEAGKVIPQIVETALQTAEVVAENIIADIEDKEKKPFKSNYHGFMVSLGGKYGVAYVGGMSLSGFPAMAMKHLINLHYLFGVAGVNACWNYLRHEFLDMKSKRTIVGGHPAAKVPVYWTVPLRMFLGAKWTYEGVKKLLEGWLNPGAGGIFNADPGSVRMPGVSFAHLAGSGADAVAAASGEAAAEAVVQAAAPVADAVAAASGEAVAQVAQAAAPVADAVSAATGDAAGYAADAATAVGAHAGGWIAGFFSRIFEITDQPNQMMQSWGVYDWFAANILSISPSFAFIMQSSVVIAEVAIGLALLSGTFTFLSAAASIGLGIMFVASGWGNPELLWYMAAALVMMGGAGRGFGLDYWIIPWTKRVWNGTDLAKRTYLYTGEPRKSRFVNVAAKQRKGTPVR